MKFVPAILALASASTLISSATISSGKVTHFQECADGWQSPSIGRQGACSHHGGVVTRTDDRRTDEEKKNCDILNLIGGTSAGGFFVTGYYNNLRRDMQKRVKSE